MMENKKVSEKKDSWLKVLLSYTEGSGQRLGISVVLSVISIISGLMPYYCIYRGIDLYIRNLNQAPMQEILRWCLYALLFYTIKIVSFSASTWISHIAAYHILEGLRLRLTDRFLKAPLGDVEGHSIGEIKSIMVEKIENMEPPIAHMIPEGSGHILLPVISFIALLTLDWRIALASLVTVPLSLVFMTLTMIISGKSFTQYDESNAHMNSTIVEYIEGIEVIKAFGRAGTSYEKYAKAILDYKKFVVKWLSSTWITMKMTFALFPSTLLGTLPVGLYLTMHGLLTISQLVLAVMLSMSMVTSFAKIEVFSENLREMQYNIESIQDFLTMKELPEPSVYANINSYDVKLENVHFSYTGEEKDEVLHGIDLTIPAGSFTALVGPSGGGKSTVARLISRFWDVTSGSITIGGVNIKEIPLSQLSEMVSFVTQDNFLFRCSIMENIRLGNPAASDEEVKEAARKACCQEFIEKLPQGYDTPAGEAGKQLSGGEKALTAIALLFAIQALKPSPFCLLDEIAIARMVLKNAPIVILDEATAFTDPENENKIQKSVEELTKGKTLLVIAHRLSTITDADKIVVLKNGCIEGAGNQEELIQNSPLYQRMWQAHVGARHWAVGSQKEGEKSCLVL